MYKRVLLTLVLASVLLPIFLVIPTISRGQEDGTVVRVEPEKVTMGPEPAVGQQFTINITLENVADLYGWEVKLFWDNSLLNCTAEEYPILPEGLNWESPNSLLLGPGIEQEYNATHGRWYHGLSALPMSPPMPEPFTGTIKLVTLTFEVIYQPPLNGSCFLDLVDTKVSDSEAVSIDHEDVDGYYEILSPPAPPTSEPMLEIRPESVNTLADSVFDIEVAITNVEAAATLVGAEFKLRYNTTILSVVHATEGSFMKDPTWALNGTDLEGPFIEDDYVVLGIILLPHVDGEYTVFPEGSGTLVTITFNATAAGSCKLELFDTKLSNPVPEPISHTTVDGFVTVTEVTVSPDVNGDGTVDIVDIILAGQSLGSYPGHSRWNPVADVNGDDVVDIYDLILIARNFGTVEDRTPPVIENVFQQPAEDNVYPDDKVEVYADVTDYMSGVKQVVLNYTTNNGTWLTIEMANLERNIWNATIPAFPYSTNVTYVVIAQDNVGNTITTQELGYEYQYHVIPEFTSLIFLAIFMIVTLLAAITYTKKQPK